MILYVPRLISIIEPIYYSQSNLTVWSVHPTDSTQLVAENAQKVVSSIFVSLHTQLGATSWFQNTTEIYVV